MANRATLEEAKELKAMWESKYPGRRFGLEASRSERQWNIKWGQPSNMVVEGEPDEKGWVAATSVAYEVFEIRICHHGKEFRTNAVGEDHSCECETEISESTINYQPAPDMFFEEHK